MFNLRQKFIWFEQIFIWSKDILFESNKFCFIKTKHFFTSKKVLQTNNFFDSIKFFSEGIISNKVSNLFWLIALTRIDPNKILNLSHFNLEFVWIEHEWMGLVGFHLSDFLFVLNFISPKNNNFPVLIRDGTLLVFRRSENSDEWNLTNPIHSNSIRTIPNTVYNPCSEWSKPNF